MGSLEEMTGCGGKRATKDYGDQLESALHQKYIETLDANKFTLEYLMTDTIRMGGLYWGLAALDVLNKLDSEATQSRKDEFVKWIVSCQHDNGGFGANVKHDASITSTHYAVLSLGILGRLDVLDKDRVISFIQSLQGENGGFKGDEWGEMDCRFAYNALACITILGANIHETVDVDGVVNWLASCKNYDGSFGPIPGSESHAAYVFCAVGALALAGRLDICDVDKLGWWLADRQTIHGGFNGRPEKAPDVCYSWWILSAMHCLERESWIDADELAAFIISAQDREDGGIADRPGDMVDVFHTYFGLAGLSLLHAVKGLRLVHPVYAITHRACKDLKLPNFSYIPTDKDFVE